MKAAITVIARRLPDEPGFQMKVVIETWDPSAPLVLTRGTKVTCRSEVEGLVTVVFDPTEKISVS